MFHKGGGGLSVFRVSLCTSVCVCASLCMSVGRVYPCTSVWPLCTPVHTPLPLARTAYCQNNSRCRFCNLWNFTGFLACEGGG